MRAAISRQATNQLILGATLVSALLAPSEAVAQNPELTANAGWVSQYYYRGILQKTPSASAGLDLQAGAFSAGTWAADVGDGAEFDLYTAVGVPLSEQFSLTFGGTGYFYTGGFDHTYLEGNLGLEYGAVSLEYSLGSYRALPTAVAYSFIGLTVARSGFFVTGGAFGSDLWLEDFLESGRYVEVGYEFTAAELDFLISSIWNDAVANFLYEGTNEVTLVFGVSKTFDIPLG